MKVLILALSFGYLLHGDSVLAGSIFDRQEYSDISNVQPDNLQVKHFSLLVSCKNDEVLHFTLIPVSRKWHTK